MITPKPGLANRDWRDLRGWRLLQQSFMQWADAVLAALVMLWAGSPLLLTTATPGQTNPIRRPQTTTQSQQAIEIAPASRTAGGGIGSLSHAPAER